MARRRMRLEDGLQVAAMEFLRWQHRGRLLAYHTPNGGYRTPIEAARFAAMGVMPGVPDITLLIPGGRVGFIELKTDSGKLSPAQVLFRATLQEMKTPYRLVRSLDELAAATTQILEESNG